MADTGTLPGPPIFTPDMWFGLIMNSERVIHRIARRRVSEYTIMATGQVPYEVFRAAAHSPDQAISEFDRYTLSVERAAADLTRDHDS